MCYFSTILIIQITSVSLARTVIVQSDSCFQAQVTMNTEKQINPFKFILEALHLFINQQNE